MASPTRLVLLGALAAATLTTASWPYRVGAYPGQTGTMGPVRSDVAIRSPSCGFCHPGPAGANKLRVAVTPGLRSLQPRQATSVRVAATGGVPGNSDGFLAEVNAGRLTAGRGSKVSASGRHVTHSAPAAPSWTFGYAAPTKPGLVEMLAVVNTTNGNNLPTGDSWGFHGDNAAALVNTPVRLYVNSPGVRRIGAGCVGGFGNYPVLGAKVTPTVGNAKFELELHGTITAASVALVVGANPRFPPVDLGSIGGPGCKLYVDTLFVLNTFTSGGDDARGEGRATFRLPIPNDAFLRGLRLQSQAAIVDFFNGRPLPVTMSNAVEVTVR